MSVDLSTTYLGLDLRNPFGVAACPPLTGNLDILRRLEDSGAAIAVLPSLFEEQITHEELELNRLLEYNAESSGEATNYFPELENYCSGTQDYLKHLESAKQVLSIPLIGSLNGSSRGGWIRYAKMIEEAGADALEMNIYFIPTDPAMTAQDVERQYVDLVSEVRQSISIPLAIKLGQNFTSLPNLCQQLMSAGADGLVLFNRYLESDIDLETLSVKPDLVLSSRHEARIPIRWIAILRDQLDMSFAASSGIHRIEDAVKLLLAGADVNMMATILLRKGPELIDTLVTQLSTWMEENEYESVSQLKGSMSRGNCPDPSALERANYMKALTNYTLQYSAPYE